MIDLRASGLILLPLAMQLLWAHPTGRKVIPFFELLLEVHACSIQQRLLVR